jgi:hypothetical protein
MEYKNKKYHVSAKKNIIEKSYMAKLIPLTHIYDRSVPGLATTLQ